MENDKLKRCKRIEHNKRYKQQQRNSTVVRRLRTRNSTDDNEILLRVKNLQQCLMMLSLTIEDVYS
jgi:hypothetical protein